MRSKGLRIGWANSASGLDLSKEKAWESELDGYKAARAQGIQPRGTSARAVREAVEASDSVGKALDFSRNDLGLA